MKISVVGMDDLDDLNGVFGPFFQMRSRGKRRVKTILGWKRDDCERSSVSRDLTSFDVIFLEVC